MECYKGGRWEERGVGRGGGWEAGGGLNPPLGLFGLARVPEVPTIGRNMLEWRNRCLPIPGGEFQTCAFHAAPSMGPIVSVMNLQGRQNSL